MKTQKQILCLFSAFIFIFSSFNATAQDPVKAILSNSDVELFIKSFDPLKTDLEKLGHKYDQMNHSSIATLSANKEVEAVFRKHGWGEDYFPKVSAIVYAFGYLKSIEEVNKLPADQQQMVAPMLSTLKTQFASMVHEKDIQVVKGKYQKVNSFFESH